MKVNRVKYDVHDKVKYNVRSFGTLIGTEESNIQAIQIFINKFGQHNRYVLSDGKFVEERDIVRKLKGKK